MKSGVVIGLAIVLAAASHVSFAQDTGPVETPELYEMDLELGLEHSDNRARSSPRGSSETALVPRVVVDLSRFSERLSVRLAGHAEQRLVLHGPFSNEFEANATGRLNWHLVEERLDWIVENVTSGSPLDLTGEDTADNRQQTNVFSTGPRWVIRPSAPWSGLLDARYIHSYAEDTKAFNSDRLALAARAVRRLVGRRKLSAGVEVTEVSYRDSEFSAADYQRLDLVGRYQSTRDAFDLDIAAGRSRIDLDHGEQLEDNLLRLRLIWTIDDRNWLVVSAGHELSDSVRQLAADIDQIDLPVPGNRRLLIGNEFYVLDSLTLGWRFRRGRLDSSLTAGWRDYQFELQPMLDLEEQTTALNLSWRLTPTMAVEAGVGLERRQFRLDDRRDNDARASLFVMRRFNPNWSGRVGVIRHQRDSNILGDDSRENIIAIYLTRHAGR